MNHSSCSDCRTRRRRMQNTKSLGRPNSASESCETRASVCNKSPRWKMYRPPQFIAPWGGTVALEQPDENHIRSPESRLRILEQQIAISKDFFEIVAKMSAFLGSTFRDQ